MRHVFNVMDMYLTICNMLQNGGWPDNSCTLDIYHKSKVNECYETNGETLHVCYMTYIKHSTHINHVHHHLPSLSHLDEPLHPAEMKH